MYLCFLDPSISCNKHCFEKNFMIYRLFFLEVFLFYLNNRVLRLFFSMSWICSFLCLEKFWCDVLCLYTVAGTYACFFPVNLRIRKIAVCSNSARVQHYSAPISVTPTPLNDMCQCLTPISMSCLNVCVMSGICVCVCIS